MPKKTTKNNYKTATIVLAVALVATLIGGACYIKKISLTREEQLRLGVFENLAQNYIDAEFTGPICFDAEKDITTENEECEHPNYNRSASTTGYGITKDGDIYADFTIYYYPDNGSHVPTKMKKGRLHFQEDKERNSWGYAYHYEPLEDAKL